MGRGDNRRTSKVLQKKAQRKFKAREKKKIMEAIAAAKNKSTAAKTKKK